MLDLSAWLQKYLIRWKGKKGDILLFSFVAAKAHPVSKKSVKLREISPWDGLRHVVRIFVPLSLCGDEIMQNKPNLPNAQLDVISILTKDYENKCLRGPPQIKPNETQF